MYVAWVPSKPAAPTTSVLGNKVVITWTAPFNAGATIDKYLIQIRQKDGIYTADATLCDGSNSGIVGLTTCTVPLLGLRAAPYNLVLGDSVFVQITAHNFYGDSPVSDAGNGALIQYPPDAPLSVQDNPSITTAS